MVNPLNFGRGTELSSEVIRYLGLKSSPVKQYSHYVMFCGGFFNPKTDEAHRSHLSWLSYFGKKLAKPCK